jgi:hypothetical protein
MNDPLKTYLHDHLAGSHFAIQLLDTLHEQYRDEELGTFAAALRIEIKGDQETLRQIADEVGPGHVDLTEVTGWLAEKASQFKLQRDDSGGGLGTFEALETLTLGIRGKLALWKVLELICEVDPRVPNLDFQALAARAEDQFARVEDQRMLLARITFTPSTASLDPAMA